MYFKLSDDTNFPLHCISIDQRLLRMEETRLFRSLDVQLADTINSSTLDESWEEQAFAVDTAGALGGCIWPPRSYSCSFCGREFRSAQALGGHMNVHRRDRARLKQSSSCQNEIVNPDEKINENPIRNSFTSMSFQYPSPVCSLVYSPNRKTEICNSLSSLSSTSRVSATPTKDFCGERILLSPSMADEEEHEKRSPISWSQFRRTSPDDRFYYEDERNPKIIDSEEKRGRRTVDSECNDEKNYIKADLSVNLTLVIRHPTPGISDQIEEAASCKRKRDDKVPSIPIFNDKHVQSEVIGLSPNSIDDLDLELRIGGTGRPRIN